MDPSSSNCENIDDESIRDNEDYEMDFLSSVAALLDCEDFRDDDAPKELGMNTPPPPPPLGDAEEELSTNVVRAAMDGKVRIFNKPNLNNGHFFKKTREQNNILHVAVRYKQKEFVRAFLKRYFIFNKKLISERNSHGNTPLHVAAQVGDKGIAMLLFNYLKKSVEGGHEGDKEKPWKAQNSKGNTALHVALLCGNDDVAESLVKRDGGLARIINNSKEAPLHLAITHLAIPFVAKDMTRVLLAKARCVASWRDAEGLTPLHRAASLDPFAIVQVTKMIIKYCPESTLVCDPSGKSFLHLLIYNTIFEVHQKNLDKGFKFYYKEEIEKLISLKEITILKDHQDQDGNTPLHIAIKCENITMVRSLLSDKCFADYNITNKDGISARFRIEQENLWNQLREPRAMTEEESSSASKGDINFLQAESDRTAGINFYGSQDSEGNNFLHLLMNTTTEHDLDCHSFLKFITETLYWFPELVCQTDTTKNTPIHILAQNKDLCNILANHITTSSESRGLLSELISNCYNAITIIKFRRTTTNESDNQDQLPWVMQNADGNTPLHEAIIANNKLLVLEFLRYSKESAGIVNKHNETTLHLLAATTIGTEEFTIEEMMKIVNANIEALGLPDKDGLIPISRAVKVENLQMVVTLLRDVQKFSDIDGQKFWHLVLTHPSKNFVNGLLQNEAFKYMLQQKDKNGNTPLHVAIKEKSFEFVQNILETWEGERESSERNQLASNQWLMDLLNILDNDGLTPIIGALKVDNLNLATRLCHVNPEAAKIGDCDGKTIWHLLPKHQSYNSEKLRELLNSEALREMLKQKDRDGNTSLHLAIKGNCFDFVQHLLETSRSEHESSNSNQWLIDLLRIPNNVGQTPEDLLADLPTLSRQLEEILLTDRRTKGIRSSWKIPRTQLQNYMNSMNVIAALQTTITFTAAFTVPGGLIQDTGTPILIRSIAFQVFMISDVIAMCLSMMVLICLLWMVATNKRKSVMIQDFAITLLLGSFFATLLTFMTGVYATVSHVKPWIAIVTLVLCSLLMLLIHRFMVTELLLPFKNAISNFVHMLLDPAAKAIKKLKSDESEHTRLDNSDTSPYERNIVITE